MFRRFRTTTLDTGLVPCYTTQVIKQTSMQDEYLTRCVVDPIKRKVYMYSSEGTEREVECETVEQFMNVLKYIREVLDEDTLAYANPL